MQQTQLLALKHQIDKAQVVSFDMYDTLVFRKVSRPEDIFLLMEFQTGIPHFASIRRKMQIRAVRYYKRKNGWPHPSLHEIYYFWKKCGWPDQSGRGQSAVEVDQAEALERTLETGLVVCNIVMRKLYDYAKEKKKRVIITTDMYLERTEIEKILKHCSYSRWDSLYVSSEIRKTKYEGSLFGYILDKERIKSGKLLHIGDNKYSDQKKAAEKGMQSFLYQDGSYDLAKSLYSKSGRQVLPCSNTVHFWYNLGYQTGGPLYMGLCTWLKEVVGEKKLYCLSRDGYNLTKLLPQFGMENFAYIYSSRRAMLLAHMTKLGREELELLPPYSCGQSIREIIGYLGFEQIPQQEFQKAGFSGYDAVIHSKHDIVRIKKVYQKERSRILKVCRKEREYLRKYFEDCRMFGKETICFDSGWNGTSQYLLEKAAQALGKPGRIRFCYAGIRESAKVRQRLQQCTYRSYFADYLDKRALHRLLSASAVLELFFSEDAPALRSYGEDSLQFDPYERREYIAAVNQGMEDYVRQNKSLFMKLSTQAVKQFGVYPIARLVLYPDRLQAKMIGDIENTDRMSEADGMKKYIAKIPKYAFWKQPFLDIYWEQGIYQHSENTLGAKCFVWIRQRAALFIKSTSGKLNSLQLKGQKK